MDIRLKDVPGYIIICVVAVAGLLLFGSVKLISYALDDKSDFERYMGYQNIDDMLGQNLAFLAQVEQQIAALGLDSGELAKAEAGDMTAQYKIGNGYLYRQDPDYAEAMRWFQKSADQQYAPAQYQLGRMHANGQSVGVNQKIATDWYLKSAEGGYKWAQIHLGEIYLHFLAEQFGVQRNFEEAYFWLSLGTTGNNDAQDDFVRDRENAKYRLTNEDVEKVDRRLEKWRQTHPKLE